MTTGLQALTDSMYFLCAMIVYL